jgi:lipoic acid synthetase
MGIFTTAKRLAPHVPTKTGMILGMGETNEEIVAVMRDLRAHGVDMLTVGQYLQPSKHHLPVLRYATPEVFAMLKREAYAMGFTHAAVGALVRSSYHADEQAHAAGVPA